MHYEFCDYRFGTETGLTLSGVIVPLPPKAHRLLAVLLAAEGRIVGKDALVAGVWGGGDVSDESISRAVFTLRTAMRRAGGPDVVQTLYNAGLRLNTPVRAGSRARVATAHALTQSSSSRAVAALVGARELAARRSPPDMEAAAASARMAIGLDPNFVAAWTTLAEIRVVQAVRGLRPAREAGRLATHAAECALALDPDCAAALALRGWKLATIDLRSAPGLADLDRAIDIDPDYWGAYLLRAWALQAAARFDEAVQMMRRALDLNSCGTAVNGLLAVYLLFAGRRGEALTAARELVQRFATIDNAHAVASTVASVHGLHDEAVAHGQQAADLAPHTPLMQVPLAYALALGGRRSAARELLTRIEACAVQPTASTAAVHLALGDRATAIARLTHGFEAGQPQFVWSRDDPRLESLRGEPAAERLWARIAPERSAARR